MMSGGMMKRNGAKKLFSEPPVLKMPKPTIIKSSSLLNNGCFLEAFSIRYRAVIEKIS